ncbi:hypothetical protein BDQ12DRAFT_672281 [Crucibulum laeve]|uniref:Uncharacterized protein n=1 Tax=Crucibulum laeve TaxID=68775 RepID=A0A5C3MFN3_9AGAR|nr:hypothetical protein BDQ12DRAFT_672281 [Crucibulum laeve]
MRNDGCGMSRIFDMVEIGKNETIWRRWRERVADRHPDRHGFAESTLTSRQLRADAY